ncbi:MAG: sialidase family protein [Rhodanobacter sp.]
MLCLGLVLLGVPPPASAAGADAIVLSEFISATPPTAQSHASTIVETPAGLVVAWFGGKHERDPGVGIWLARQLNGHWSRPLEVADGRQPDGTRQPSWNPVLFRPRGGPLMLFYKVGPDPQHWWGMRKTSQDDGAHWSAAQRLPDGVLGPIKDKPVQLADGSIVSPSSTELGRWRIHFERSEDGGRTWAIGAPIANPQAIEAIQPSLLPWSEGNLQAIGRTRQNHLFTTRSHDGGRSWSVLKLLDVANPNSGIDAVVLRDHRAVLVYNPTHHGKDWWDGRGTLAVAISRDGRHWKNVLTLEHAPHAEFSYPATIQTSDGMVHIVYTWKRLRIKHVVIDPAKL